MDMELLVCGPMIGGMFVAELLKGQSGVINRQQALAEVYIQPVCAMAEIKQDRTSSRRWHVP